MKSSKDGSLEVLSSETPCTLLLISFFSSYFVHWKRFKYNYISYIFSLYLLYFKICHLLILHLPFIFYYYRCSCVFRYQQEGINWLAFLKRFKLHGILCDDMGLGKTLQASAIVASDIAEHRSTIGNEDLLASLIICPSTLVGHWAFEIEKYIDVSVISSLQYVGSAQERILLRDQFCKHNVIITSYDVVRKDVDFLGQLLWNYCILDEGHIIKNAKSKVTLAVKQLKAQHRLILSGTPIQVCDEFIPHLSYILSLLI